VDEATSVVVQISKIDLLRSDGDDKEFTFAPPRRVDLLDFSAGLSTILLDRVRVPEGDYTGLRVTIDSDDSTESHIDLNTGARERLVLSGATDEFTIEEPFTIERRKELALTLEIDLRLSVLPPANVDEPYEFAPSTRLVNDADAATISGAISEDLVSSSSCLPVVYVYAGHDIDADDIGSPLTPVASAAVKLGSVSGVRNYKVAFLLAGEYSVAFTCDALQDDPRDDDDIVFSPSAEVSVDASETATANFE
jgi:hypothetical protein